jgi:hypothetical protein
MLSLSIPSLVLGASQEKQEPAVSVGKTAGIGALLGLALGRSVGDVIGGAALGAAGGMIANEAMKDRSPQEKTPSADEQARAAEEKSKVEQEAAFEQAIGEDNYEGYKALRACQHERAFALAKAGGTSQSKDHRLASLWLEAMIAVDTRDTAEAEAYYKELVKADPDIDTVQQAGIATDQAVLNLRTERREMGLPSCR